MTLVYDIAPDAAPVRKSDPGASLRMLAVFAQPTETSVLALRRERYALTRLVRRIAARERAVVELQVVQYGATRERLREIADSGDGWDVLHLSGHGTGGAFLLEEEDGSPDAVATADLVALLRPAKRRVRLAVVSACESAADTTAQTLRLLGLTEQADALEAETADGQAAAQVPGLARALVRELGCPVVAMRYPVTDEFAIAFGDGLQAERSPPAAAGPPSCCTEWRARARPPARSNSPTGTRTRSPSPRSGRHPQKTASGREPSPTSRNAWTSSLPTTASRWPATSARSRPWRPSCRACAP